MIHHLSLGTNDLERARRFYDAVMREIGLRLVANNDRFIAYGLTDAMFSVERPVDGKPASPGNGTHVAFRAGHPSVVDAGYRAGLSSGGTSEGEPGIRAEYDVHYYAAFLRDPDGNKIELVTFAAT